MERKITILAKEQFKGKICLAIKHIIENPQVYNCEEFYVEFNEQEKSYFELYLYDIALKESKTKDIKLNPISYYRKIRNKLLPITSQQPYVITNEVIQKELKDYNKGFKLFLYTLVIPLPSFLTIVLTILGIATESIVLTIAPAVILFIGLFMLFKFCKILKTKNGYKYYILKDICVKKVEYDNGPGEGGGVENYLHFKKSGKYRLNATSCPEFTSWSLFNLTEEGDKFYLVKTENNKIRFIYPANNCEIDKNSFIDQEDVFSPL